MNKVLAGSVISNGRVVWDEFSSLSLAVSFQSRRAHSSEFKTRPRFGPVRCPWSRGGFFDHLSET